MTIAALVSALSLHAGFAVANATTDEPPLQAIPSLDLQSYLGSWYEIAKYPNRFQKHCASDSRAEYSLREDGRVQVINRCLKSDGSASVASGVARRVGAPDAATFEVRFAPAWLSFLPMVWGDYWVIDLDPVYRLAAVSEPSRRYLWILSRSPGVESEAYEQLLNRLEASGFDLSRLESSPQ